MEIPQSTPPPDIETIALNENKASFGLAKLISDIKRGEDIFAFPSSPTTSGTLCNYKYGSDAVYTYAGGRNLLGNWSSELGVIFYETLTNMGYSVAGDPNNLFEERSSAEYLIAGRLMDMKGNFCHEHDWWDGHPLKTYSGEMYVEFEWSLQNTLTKERILKKKTTGYYKQEKPINAGVTLTFQEAFIASLQKFASLPEVQKLAKGEALSHSVALLASGEKTLIQNGKSSAASSPSSTNSKVVTIRVGGGHGSGFLVGRNGYILTNHHVVGGAKHVMVITPSGLSLEGEVVARNKVRDVALVKTPIKTRDPLHIRMQSPAVGEEVFALGAPLDEGFRNNMSRGIVSGYHISRGTGLNMLRSDTAINGGNSGGPLVDGKGRVVAISVAKSVGADVDSMSFFIPIADAFKYLPIKLSDK